MRALAKGALTGALAILAAPVAQAEGLALEANGARADGDWGGELGAGYNLGFAGFTLRPAAGVFLYNRDNDRFTREDLSNGQTRCRDRTNGRFADDDQCDTGAARLYARLEATYTIPLSAELGVGARLSRGDLRPYATVSFPLLPRVRIKGNAGEDYFALGLRADL